MSAASGGQTAKYASWDYAEQHPPEDSVQQAARQSAADLGATTISRGTAAALTVLAAAAGARAVVEVGTGTGTSGIALLRGAASDAVLTSIDADPDHIAAARRVFAAGGIPNSRTRLITGHAEHVLPRLTAARYDVVFIDAEPARTALFAAEGLRLLRPGGVMIVNDALDGDQVPKPAVRQEATRAMRDTEQLLLEHESVSTALFGTGTGLLVGVKKA